MAAAPTSSSNLFASGSKASSGGEAITEAGSADVRRVGRTNVVRERPGLYPGMDQKRGLFKPVDVSFTTDSCMSQVEAGRVTLALLKRCGLDTEDDSLQLGWIKAVQLSMAVNSSSQLVPGRAKFYVAGSEFDFFADIMVPLGNDARRYFRAYADATRGYLQDLISEYQHGPASDDEKAIARYEDVSDMYDAVMRVAEKRGLTRVPYLIHDSAEFCSNKTSIETLYLTHSKDTIFATGAHSANLVDNPVVSKSRSSRPVGAVVTSAGGDAMPDGY